MNKEVIVYMPQKIPYKAEMPELEKVLKEMVLFFVLQIQEIELIFKIIYKNLYYSHLRYLWLKVQFSVSGSGFSVLVRAPGKFYSLYLAPDSLKMKK